MYKKVIDMINKISFVYVKSCVISDGTHVRTCQNFTMSGFNNHRFKKIMNMYACHMSCSTFRVPIISVTSIRHFSGIDKNL